jgi:H+/Cl- antiporter ClcA
MKIIPQKEELMEAILLGIIVGLLTYYVFSLNKRIEKLEEKDMELK